MSADMIQLRFYGLQQALQAFGIGRHNIAAFKVAAATLEVADQATRFANQQHARRDIPFAQADFPETVQATGGNISQIQRGSSYKRKYAVRCGI